MQRKFSSLVLFPFKPELWLVAAFSKGISSSRAQRHSTETAGSNVVMDFVPRRNQAKLHWFISERFSNSCWVAMKRSLIERSGKVEAYLSQILIWSQFMPLHWFTGLQACVNQHIYWFNWRCADICQLRAWLSRWDHTPVLELLWDFLCEISVQSSQGLGSAILSRTADLCSSLSVQSGPNGRTYFWRHLSRCK